LRPQPLSQDEKAFATHLAYGTLRHRGTIDAIIHHASGRTASEVDPELWWTLQLGVHQWLWMNTPAHAAVNESVKLAKQVGAHRGSGLINAVMRKITAHDLTWWLDALSTETDTPAGRLGILHSHPIWLVEGFEEALAECEGTTDADLVDLLEANNTPATPHLALLPELAQSEVSDVPLPFSPVGVEARAGSPGNDSRVRSGVARVQDEGSQLAALTLTDGWPLAPGERLLDMCSGPGGKAALLAARAAVAGSSLTAVEKAPHRADLVRKALAVFERVTPAPRVVSGDAEMVLSDSDGEYDRVLLDAPCTGAGALRRRPESRWRKKPEDLDSLVPLQRALLARAVAVTKPGGLVVYVTCSPLSGETSRQIEWLEENFPVTLLDTPGILERITRKPLTGHRRGNAVQLWPHRHQTDAMFIQAFRRDQ
jgi:16S rRNA (cytosine967-C5)-methyltransferase